MLRSLRGAAAVSSGLAVSSRSQSSPGVGSDFAPLPLLTSDVKVERSLWMLLSWSSSASKFWHLRYGGLSLLVLPLEMGGRRVGSTHRSLTWLMRFPGDE